MEKKLFDIDSISALEVAEMEVMINGQAIGWTWKFAGPGHPATIDQNNRVAREQLAIRKLQEQAQVNGKKWKAPEKAPDDILKENIEYVLERLLDWSEVSLAGEPYPFSKENARKLLMDRSKSLLLQQANDFLLEDSSFIKPSAKS